MLFIRTQLGMGGILIFFFFFFFLNKQYKKGTKPLKLSAVQSCDNFGLFNSWNWHSDDRHSRIC